MVLRVGLPPHVDSPLLPRGNASLDSPLLPRGNASLDAADVEDDQFFVVEYVASVLAALFVKLLTIFDLVAEQPASNATINETGAGFVDITGEIKLGHTSRTRRLGVKA